MQSTEKVLAAQQETADVLIPLQDSAIQCPCRDLARNRRQLPEARRFAASDRALGAHAVRSDQAARGASVSGSARFAPRTPGIGAALAWRYVPDAADRTPV